MALPTSAEGLTPKELFLRHCFDAWHFWMAVIEEHPRSELINVKDVAFVCRHYVHCLMDDPNLFEACVQYIDYNEIGEKVGAFLNRFRGSPQ